METKTEWIHDVNDIGIEVTYDYEVSESQIEECHGFHDVGGLVYTELLSVKLYINEDAIELLHLLNDEQKSYILKELPCN